jgi:type II secretory pathway component GspD/PulD (secretin)
MTRKNNPAPTGRLAAVVLMLLASLLQDPAFATARNGVTLSVQDTEISEVMNMLSQKERLNILLASGVEGNVSLSLYDVELDEAIRSVARAGGYAVEMRGSTYFIIKPEDAGVRATSDITRIRTFRVQYSDPEQVKSIIENHLSSYGEVTALSERNMLVVEDTPDYLRQVSRILKEIDREPNQVFIEAKILQVTLSDSDVYGINWARLFNYDSGDGAFGVTGLSSPGSGLFFSLLTPNIDVALEALETMNRVRSLSSPKLLALEGQKASVVIGERQGYRVTTTINQVTTESIEFLESGVILDVTPRVDAAGRIMMEVHPEVSVGSVSLTGIPSQNTTEVTTQMLAEDGRTLFIGGLIRNNTDDTKEGVPVLGSIPLLGKLFSSTSKNSSNAEFVVLITPYVVGGKAHGDMLKEIARLEKAEKVLIDQPKRIEREFQPKKLNWFKREQTEPAAVESDQTGLFVDDD